MKHLLVAVTLAMTLIASPAHAGRDGKKIGVFAGIITTPFPSAYGFGAAYNLNKYLRVSGNIGFLSVTESLYTLKATSLGADIKAFFPAWNFSPYATLGFVNVDATVTGATPDLSALGGLTESAATLTYGFGIDWQTDLGFNLGVEYEILSKTGDGLPGVYMGWYF